MISSVNLQNNFSTRVQYLNTVPINFTSNTTDSQSDTFESGNNEKTQDKSKYFWMTTTFATLGALIATKFKLTKAVEKAAKDGMTGLYNKTRLLSDLKKTVAKSVENGQEYSVAMLDMDNFKAVNEVFGHKTGDTFLKRIADNINSVAQKYNVKGYRYGGEEFAVIMPNTNKETAYKIISEVAESIKRDEVIQSYLPQFKETVTNNIEFLNKALDKLGTKMFRNLRHRQGEKIDNYSELSTSVISFIEEHIKRYNPSDTKNLNEILNKLQQAKPEELPELLSVHTKFGTSTLGNELDNIHHQYTRIRNFSQDWMNHLEQHKNFTISGGVATFDKTTQINNTDDPIKIADAALKSAKENGKNIIAAADESLIKKILEEQSK